MFILLLLLSLVVVVVVVVVVALSSAWWDVNMLYFRLYRMYKVYFICIMWRVNGVSFHLFFNERSKYLDYMAIISYDSILTGDFNFHIDNKFDVEVRRFCSRLDSYGLNQNVNKAINKGSHILDLVISR